MNFIVVWLIIAITLLLQAVMIPEGRKYRRVVFFVFTESWSTCVVLPKLVIEKG